MPVRACEAVTRLSPTVVIGAGPYGLSVAAHLRARGLPVVLLGKPMEFWERMPQGLFLKSPWHASNLSDPKRAYTLDRYVAQTGVPRTEPLPLPFFLRYARWFQERAAGDVDPGFVTCLERWGGGFRLTLADGRVMAASRVVLAVGIDRFAHIPDFARALPTRLASHSQSNSDFSIFSERRVAVIGAGQSGLESAALLREAGAEVEVIARRPVNWIRRRFTESPARFVLYPPTDVGPTGLSWVIAFPFLVHRLPARARGGLRRRAMRPAGAKWLRPRVVGQVRITANAAVRNVRQAPDRLCIELTDGTSRELDHLLLATGYRPTLQAIPFLHDSVRDSLRQADGYPLWNQWYESSVPGLHIIGGLAGFSFGPLANFVAGAGAAARRVARRAARDA
jgi:FAD-dependent urate hydroxylase